jgi:hypothetical protein
MYCQFLFNTDYLNIIVDKILYRFLYQILYQKQLNFIFIIRYIQFTHTWSKVATANLNYKIVAKGKEIEDLIF